MRNWSTWKEGKSAYPLQNDAGDSSYSQCGEKGDVLLQSYPEYLSKF
jgi:hypothetical protein